MKLLRVVLSGEEHPNYTITKAFESQFDTTTIWWEKQTPIALNEMLFDLFSKNTYDAVFMQLQKGGIVFPETAKMMASKSLVFNWTGDVRNDLTDYREISNYVITLFTNMTDVTTFISEGKKAAFLQVGFDNFYYKDLNKHRLPFIIFCGNHYPNHDFPLTQMRIDMVRRLQSEFPKNFKLYGNGWYHAGINSYGYLNNQQESEIYNGAVAAISLSHFDRGRYFSDRLLRIMACNTTALSHNYVLSFLDFENNKDIIFWNNLDELVEQCRKCLDVANYGNLREIANEGMKKVYANYTWDDRVKEFKNLIKRFA